MILVTANFVPRKLILSTLMKEIRSSETSVLARATRRQIQEYGIPQMPLMSVVTLLSAILHFKSFPSVGCPVVPARRYKRYAERGSYSPLNRPVR
jgi:hypothetical protein